MGLYNDMTNIKADRIFVNGRIYTENEEVPWADAVACKYGEILDAGSFNSMKNLEDEYTEIIDLKGKFMFPGFIDAHSSTVFSIFRDTYTVLDSSWDMDTVIGEIADCCYDAFDDHLIFAYGFNEMLLRDFPDEDERCRLFDEIETDCPVLLLSADGCHFLYNSICREKIKAVFNKEDICELAPEAVLNALMIFDEDELRSNFDEEKERLTDKGFTTVFNYNTPLCFNKIYKNLFSDREGEIDGLNQTFCDTVFVNSPLSEKKLSSLLEKAKLNKHCNTVKINASEENFTSDDLDYICLFAAERGFNLHVDALDENTLKSVYASYSHVRKEGYTDITLVIASDIKLPKELRESYPFSETFLLTFASDALNNSVFSHSISVHDAIDQLTIKAAELIGKKDVLGSVEKGKRADFTVFSEDIFKSDLKTFSRLHCDMIISDGEILYDVDEENFDEMVNLLFNMQL